MDRQFEAKPTGKCIQLPQSMTNNGARKTIRYLSALTRSETFDEKQKKLWGIPDQEKAATKDWRGTQLPSFGFSLEG